MDVICSVGDCRDELAFRNLPFNAKVVLQQRPCKLPASNNLVHVRNILHAGRMQTKSCINPDQKLTSAYWESGSEHYLHIVSVVTMDGLPVRVSIGEINAAPSPLINGHERRESRVLFRQVCKVRLLRSVQVSWVDSWISASIGCPGGNWIAFWLLRRSTCHGSNHCCL